MGQTDGDIHKSELTPRTVHGVKKRANIFRAGIDGIDSARFWISNVIVVAALFGLVAFARSLKKFEAQHFWASIILLVVLAGFGVAIYIAGDHLGNLVGPTLHDLEVSSSP